jgi:tripartite-type tricarboxylate transporter receptor subunit TctC
MKRLIVSVFVIFLISIFLSKKSYSVEFSPTKNNIEIVVPNPPGGAVDTIGRMIAEIFEKKGWKAIVVNKPGGDQTIGTNYVAQSIPNGHTLLLTGNGAMDANIVFDAPGRNYDENSLEGVGMIGYGSYVLVVSNESSVKNYEQFKKYVKENPSKFKIGFFNVYTAAFIKEWAKIEGLPEPTIVPYKGSAPQITDILGGHIEFTFDTLSATSKLYSSDKLKIIATLDDRNTDRVQKIKGDKKIIALSKLSPELQQGPWYGLFVKAKTEKKVKEEIYNVILAGINQIEYKNKLEEFGVFHLGGDAKELDQHTKRLREFYRKSLKQ